MTGLYFGYGSNLNHGDWERWRRNHGFDANLLEPLFAAWLPDRELAFTVHSGARNGGVLDVRPRVGQLAPGVAFRIHGSGWEALDSKEGASGFYHQIETTCLNFNGEAFAVTTYEVNPEKREDFAAPHAGYVDVVREGIGSTVWRRRSACSIRRPAASQPSPSLMRFLFTAH